MTEAQKAKMKEARDAQRAEKATLKTGQEISATKEAQIQSSEPRVSSPEAIPVQQHVNVSTTDTTPRKVKIVVNPRFSWKHGVVIMLRNHDGKHPLIDVNGNPSQVFALKVPVLELDLNKERDKLIVENAKSQPTYYLNRPSDPLYTIVSEEEETEETITSFEETMQCADILKDMGTEELVSFARLFAINPDKMTLKRVKSELYGIAQENPQTIINMFNDQYRTLRQLLRKSLQRKVIENKQGVYQWKGYILGGSMEEVVNWMDQHEDLVHVINQQAEAVEIK